MFYLHYHDSGKHFKTQYYDVDSDRIIKNINVKYDNIYKFPSNRRSAWFKI